MHERMGRPEFRTRPMVRLAFGLLIVLVGGLVFVQGPVKRAAELGVRIIPNSALALQTVSPAFHLERASGTASAFVDSVGIQTHISYVDTPYGKWQQVMEELARLGVHHIRDALPLTATFLKNHQQLAAAGIRCTCGFAIDKAITADEIVQAARAASDVEALEAPNECDAGSNCGGGGKTGVDHAVAVLPVLATAGQVLHVPVIGPSFTTAEAYRATGSISRWVEFNNLHVYFGGRNPGTEGWGAGDAQGHRYGSVGWWIDQSNINAPGTPIEITETGYESFDNPSRAGTVSLPVESSYLLRTLLLAWSHGIQKTFVYELLDEFPGSGYGLLRHDLTEKPGFTALRNLLASLRDPSQPNAPGYLSFAIAGGDSSLEHVLLQRSDGSFDLILWIEQSTYDAQSHVITPVAPADVQLRLESKFKALRVITFHSDGSIESQGPSVTTSPLHLTVNDQPSIVRIVPR